MQKNAISFSGHPSIEGFTERRKPKHKRQVQQIIVGLEVGSLVQVLCLETREYKAATVLAISAVGQMFVCYGATGEKRWVCKHTEIWRLLPTSPILPCNFSSSGEEIISDNIRCVENKSHYTTQTKEPQAKKARCLLPAESTSSVRPAPSKAVVSPWLNMPALDSPHQSRERKKRSGNIKNSEDKASSTTALMQPHDEIPFGTRVEVYWEGEHEWYAGTVTQRRTNGDDCIEYDDGDTESINLHEYERFRVLVPELVTVGSKVEIWWEDDRAFHAGIVTKQDGTDWGRVEYEEEQVGWTNFRETPFAFLTGSNKRNSALLTEDEEEEEITIDSPKSQSACTCKSSRI